MYRVTAISLASAFVSTAAAAPLGGPFVRIADSSGPYAAFGPAPSVNAGGTVAFNATQDAGGSAVLRSDGRSVTQIADSGQFEILHTAPAINASGEVAFAAVRTLDTERGVYKGTGGPLTTIQEHPREFLDVDAFPAINDAGVVAFLGPASGSTHGILGGRGGAVTVYDFGTANIREFGSPDVNNAGLVAYRARVPGATTLTRAVFVSDGTTARAFVDSSSPYLGFSDPVINEAGRLAFAASRDDLSVTVTTHDGATTRDLATSDGPFRSFGPVSLNNHGVVAFGAILDTRTAPADGGVDGIFTGPDPIADRVIGLGDPLDGSTIEHMRFGRFALNDAGQIAFTATLADGRQGVYLYTTPMLLPEPAAPLVCLGATLLLGRRGRRH